MSKRWSNWTVTVNDKKTITKKMIPVYLVLQDTGLNTQYMKKLLKLAKKWLKKASVKDIWNWKTDSYIHCVIAADHNKHYVYIKTVCITSLFYTKNVCLQWCAPFTRITCVKHLLHSKHLLLSKKHQLWIRLILKTMLCFQ